MSELSDEYEDLGNEPTVWSLFGRNLLLAADVLHERAELQQAKAGSEIGFEALAISGAMLMLRACAIECLLKALYLATGEALAAGGRYAAPPGRSHDLLALARAAKLSMSKDEEVLLARLSRWVTAGRYPIQTDASKTFNVPGLSSERRSGWDAPDESGFWRLRERLVAVPDDQRLRGDA
jgi:hypothetical protein